MMTRDEFGALSTSQVLNLINLAKKSGTLQVFNHHTRKKKPAAKARHNPGSQNGTEQQAEIYFQDGLVLSASLGSPEYHLASTLHKAGKLSQNRLRAVLRYTRDLTDRQLALVLIDRGYITKQAILKVVQDHTRDIVLEVMGWEEKHCEFHETVPDLSGHILVPIDPKDIIADATRQTHDTQRLEKAVPDLNVALKFVDDPAEKFRDVDLTADEWRVVGFINTNKTVQQIAQACNMTETEIRRVVFALRSAGIIELDDVSDPPPKSSNGFHRENLRKLETQIFRFLGVGNGSRQDQNGIDWISDQLSSGAVRGDPEGIFKDGSLQLGVESRQTPPVQPPPAPTPAVTTGANRTKTALRRGKSAFPRQDPVPVSTKPPAPPPPTPDPPPVTPIVPKPEPSREPSPTLSRRTQIIQPVPKADPVPPPSPAEVPELTDAAVETLVMRPVKDVDFADHTREAVVFPKEGWLILDFGKKQFTLATNRTLILGRSPTHTTHAIVDVSPCGGLEKGVSRNHAAIYVAEDGCLVICDLGSKNGTFINNKQLAPLEPYRLYDGDEVRLGNLKVQVYYLAKFETATSAKVEPGSS